MKGYDRYTWDYNKGKVLSHFIHILITFRLDLLKRTAGLQHVKDPCLLPVI